MVKLNLPEWLHDVLSLAGGAVMLLLVLVSLVLPGWVFSVFGAGLAELLGDVLGRVGALWPWRRGAPWFALLAAFLALRMLTLPWDVTLMRGGRSARSGRGRCAKLVDFLHSTMGAGFVVGFLDSAVLFIIGRAFAKAPPGWVHSAAWLVLPPPKWLEAFILLLWEFALAHLILWVSTPPRGKYRCDDDFMAEVHLGPRVCLWPTVILLSILYSSQPFLLTMVACYLIARLFFTGVAGFLSLWLDRANERRIAKSEARQDRKA